MANQKLKALLDDRRRGGARPDRAEKNYVGRIRKVWP